ncbi:hypothetical protein FGG08_005747 [Glutinoglossum americanum]|uniref:Uncharacterized protein n=1 Tax=Glutinoglossum americanum TaxID=1670608 RepID=A0A9P8I8S2_9PEZI|nr:hypothetical protein FGG08_005747 [Glutinoglossum americanum]
MNKEQWRFSVGGTSVEVREQVDRIVKIVLVAKDSISSVASLGPIHAGLPWAGVCTLLPFDAILKSNTFISKASRIRSRESLRLLLQNFTARSLDTMLELPASSIDSHSNSEKYRQSWQTILKNIELSETACDKLLAIIDAQDQRSRMKRLQSVLGEQNRKIDELLRVSREQDKEYEKLLLEVKSSREEQRDRCLTDEKPNCLQALRTSAYEEHKA